MDTKTLARPKKDNPLLNLLVDIVIPAFILSKLAKPEYLGFTYGLILALSFPLLHGLYDLTYKKRVHFFSILGLINTLLTGGIGLLELNKFWIIVKETAIPLLMGLAIFISQKTRWPLVTTLLKQILDLKKIKFELERRGLKTKLDKQLKLANLLLGGSCLISALLNYILATILIRGAPGSSEFAASLGDMLKYSFVAIAIPMAIMVSLVLYLFLQSVKKDTHLEMSEVLRR